MSLFFFLIPNAEPEVFYSRFGDAIQRELNPDDWDGTVQAYLEIHGLTDDAGKPLRARLYNVSDSAPVAGSGLSSVATTKTRARSSAFTLASGDKVYEVEYGGEGGGNYTLFDAVVIVDVTP